MWFGRPGAPVAIVLHTMGGTLTGTDGWFGSQASQVSAHTGVGLQGERHRYVMYGHRAWANGILEPGNMWGSIHGHDNPNQWTLSIETEDMGDPAMPVTDLQYAAVLAEAREMLAAYPQLSWLLQHADISPQSRAHCPGARWVASGRFAALAAELGLRTFL